jgi:hypothetical protein
MPFTMSIANSKYSVVIIKKITSLTKNRGVTLIILIGGPFLSTLRFDARVVSQRTTVQMKKVPPIKMLTA